MTLAAALEGVRAIDLSQQLPGPFATLLLQTLGAEVTKVEPPGGDPARSIDPDMFARVNGGKHVVVLDLKSEAGRAELHELVRMADVVVEGFRPGVTARLAADYASLAAINPAIVYCSISGFGSGGPLAQRPGHDLNFAALAAAVAVGDGDGEALIRVPWVDLAAGTNAALAITAALHARERTGDGTYLDMALLDAAVAWAHVKQPRAGAEGAYGVFETADGEAVAVSVMEAPMWARLCAALGWDDWAGDAALADHDARRAAAVRIRARLAGELSRLPREDVLALADEYDLPITAVNHLADVDADEQVATRGVVGQENWNPLGHAAERKFRGLTPGMRSV